MMIDRDFDGYSLACDICGEEATQTFDDFWDAVQYKKDNDWKSQRRNGDWEDVCPDCQENPHA